MKALKAVVILMAVVLVAGFTGLIYMWQQKRAGLAVQGGRTPTVVAPEAPVTVTPPDRATVWLPVGAQVISISSAGNVIDVLVQNADGSRDLYQVSRADGSVLGTLRFRQEAP